jgi:hypothetical protein
MKRVCCTYHCRACNSHFASEEAFDAHRFGPHNGERVCLEVDQVEALAVKSNDGVCDIAGPETIEGVVVWTSRRSLGRAEAAFGPSKEPVSELGVKRGRASEAESCVPARAAA